MRAFLHSSAYVGVGSDSLGSNAPRATPATPKLIFVEFRDGEDHKQHSKAAPRTKLWLSAGVRDIGTFGL